MSDPVSEALTKLLAAGASLRAQLDSLYAKHGLTSSAFDVLRVLRERPDGRARGEIAQRLLHRAPDVTRLIDRLERRGYVKRLRRHSDRRLSVSQITPKGLEVVARIEPVIDEYRNSVATRLSVDEWAELSRLCERLVNSR